MSGPARPDLRRLAALAGEIRLELEAAGLSGNRDRADLLRGELALLEDLALPEAADELRLQRIACAATSRAMERGLPPDLLRFLG